MCCMGEDDRRRLADDEADERDVDAAARDKLSEGRPGQAEHDEAARERMRDHVERHHDEGED